MIYLEQQLATLPEPYIVMGVGIPGSGKSTALEVVAQHLEIARICPDDIREEMTGSAADQSVNAEAWAEAYRRVAVSLQLGHSAIIDGTHTEAWRRPKQVAQYREHGAAAVAAVVFDTPLAVAKRRNLSRERVVPEYALDKLHTALQKEPVSHKEGFDAIYVLR
jgi:predicted kinase